MGDDLDLVLSCEGHRVIVPSRGTRGLARGGVPGRRTHRIGLWCPDSPWEKLTADRCTVGTARP
ncbi:hypothetical protein CP970_21930 [Streptomyces kanamyceticus]|uniref:Uncharacterized protein n=1 Tax=Streptomyces kanamyceticus TaxID=1967 RepID=A0A5J6GGV0_STRKN|nr:hypothetical protein CP970_21930 [Streptomyces kanamyceticus]